MELFDEIFDKEDYKLVVAIVARGYAGEVINMAKSAGAKGAVVLSGTGSGESQKSFFGFVVNPENEVVLIVTKTEIVVDVMQNIYKAVDFKSSARGLVFALPIDHVTGMSHARIEEEEKESKETLNKNKEEEKEETKEIVESKKETNSKTKKEPVLKSKTDSLKSVKKQEKPKKKDK